MTISLKSDASGNSGAIQVAGVDRLTLNLDGSLLAGANPATGNRSMAIATMQKFADEFGASLTGNGYQKLPSGLIIQWGYGTGPASGTSTFSFPIAFPNAAFAVTGCQVQGVSEGVLSIVQLFNVTNSKFSFSATQSFTAFNFFAVGH